jgi:hypothetical protein
MKRTIAFAAAAVALREIGDVRRETVVSLKHVVQAASTFAGILRRANELHPSVSL